MPARGRWSRRGRCPDEGGRAATPAAAFVGRAVCEKCHAEETRRWRGSHHDLAMQEASEQTVVGNFENASFTHFGVTSMFFRRDGKFFVRTDGPDGRLTEYPIAYTFGIFPLQQYLIAFPGGRYQALNVCWDTRPAKQGGQRWFHLYPKEEVAHGDPLHWTGPYQNWNFMCAECHSTNVTKGYHPDETATRRRSRRSTSPARRVTGRGRPIPRGARRSGPAGRRRTIRISGSRSSWARA